MTTVIEHAIEIARPSIDASGQNFEAVMPRESLTVSGDLTRLAQVLSNLLINAAKFTPAEGRIRLHAYREGDEAVVKVEDNGVGIAEEHLDNVFEMFSQVPSAAGQSQGGLGIGLSLARGLAEMHGGRLRAVSAGVGKGSSFVMQLPLVGAVPSQAATAAPKESEGTPGCRILVVDDLRDSADTLGMLLQTVGLEVKVVYGGEDAVALAEQFRPDVAFIDLGMPIVDGFEACRRIRAQPWGEKMVLIAQTGWGQEFDRRRTQTAGFDQHLVKPLEWEQLESVLRRVVRHSGQSTLS